MNKYEIALGVIKEYIRENEVLRVTDLQGFCLERAKQVEEKFTSNQQAQPEICPECKGEGYVYDHHKRFDRKCDKCDGSGKIVERGK